MKLQSSLQLAILALIVIPGVYGSDFDTSSCPITISGTAQGGTVTLDFPPNFFKDFNQITITTASGDSAEKVAQALLDAFAAKTTVFDSSQSGRDGSTLNLPRLLTMSVGLRSTDPGIFNLRSVQSLIAKPTASNDIKLEWKIKQGVLYDRIWVVGDSSRTDHCGGAATTLTATINGNSPSVTALKTLEYRVIGVKNGTPSEVAVVSVANPKYAP